MQRKIIKSCRGFLIVVSISILLTPFNIELSCSAEESSRSPGLVSGSVYYSSDGLAKIYEGANWSCTNITAYCIDEYRNGTVDLAIDNGSADKGEDHPDKLYDEFEFDPAYQWANENFSKEHIAVGENEINGSCYVFITGFFYNLTPMMHSFCKSTEWELIPTPVIYAKGDAWINISIPKFTNPQKELYGDITTNADNTIGFAVYRDGIFVSNTTFSNETHYFFKDTNLSGTKYTYSVAPIARGGYITYGKSSPVEMTNLGITLNSPNGGEDWTGNKSHKVSYAIEKGEPPFIVDLFYSTDNENWIWANSTTCEQLGTNIYNWITPSIDSKTVKFRINVTDNKSVTDFDTSNNTFEIDSKPPTVLNAFPVSTGAPAEALVIHFNESVNTSSVENAFSITPNPGNLSWDWDKENKTATISHDNFTLDVQYNCRINTLVKDDSEPGNYMEFSHNWSFVGAVGYGNFTVDVDYPPSLVRVEDNYQIKASIANALEGAVNKSGTLKFTFYRSEDNKTFNQIGDMKMVGGMMPDNSTTVNSDVFSFTYAGTWYLKVNFTSTNPDDVINGYPQYYETFTYTVNVVPSEEIEEEEREIGPGPYALIALMVIIVVLIGIYTIWSRKKK